MSTTETPETSALTAALEAPSPFRTRVGTMALHSAERHVDRFAPEQGATSRSRSLRSLAFVDRLVSPWVETAQRSAGLRMFGEYMHGGWGERAVAPVSWVFPRPWYQDELDWMAAARSVAQMSPGRAAITTRGTYVAAQQPHPMSAAGVMSPLAMLELVAPSLTIANASTMPVGRDGAVQAGLAGAMPASAVAARPLAAWSPLVPFAAAQAAQMFAGTIGAALSSGLSAAERSPILSALSFVAPSEMTAPAGEEPTRSAPRFAPRPTAPDAAPLAGMPSSALQAQLTTTLRQIEEIRAHGAAVAAEQAQRAAVTPVAPEVAPPEVAPPSVIADEPIAPTAAETARVIEQLRTAAVEQARVIEHARVIERLHDVAATAAAEAAAPALSRTERAAEVARLVAETRAEDEPARAAELARSIEILRADEARVVAAEQRAAAASAEIARVEAAQVDVRATIGASGMTPAVITSIAQAIASSPSASIALRAIELLTRAAATGRAPAPIGGPRVAMPAGLGGLVAGVDTAGAVHRPMTASVSPLAAASMPYALATAPGVIASGDPGAARRATFAPVWAMPAASSGALGAIEHDRPAAVDHVAWADRWLARFAGASPQALASFDSIASPMSFASSPMALRAATAPDAVYVAPMLPSIADGAAAPGDVRGSSARTAARAPFVPTIVPPVAAAPSSPGAAATTTPASPSAAPARSAPRFDDAASVPDDVFAAIFAPQAAPAPRPAPRAVTSTPATSSVGAAPQLTHTPSLALVDRIAQSAPSAPGAGLFASLASSPIAPALLSLLALPSAPAFDTRALFTGGLALSYLEGALAPAMQFAPASIAAALAAADRMGAPLAAFASSPMGIDALISRLAGLAPSPDYVAPLGPDAGADAGPVATRDAGPVATRGAGLVATGGAGPVVSVDAPGRAAVAAPRPEAVLAASMQAMTPAARAAEPIAVRSSLLATPAMQQAAGLTGATAGTGPSLDTPMAEAPRAAWTAAPGMTGARAQSWAIDQERSAANLSFDFVAPELVLAARVYGFGPAEAAQAQRLALAGPSALAAMATTLDLTFLRAVQAGGELRRTGDARAARAAIDLPVPGDVERVAPMARAAHPDAATDGALAPAAMLAVAPTGSAAAPTGSAAAPSELSPITAYPLASAPAPGERASLFGVDRKLPRGAFLWPASTVGAIGLQATTPEGLATLPIAALELLAASAVADLGSWVVSRELNAAGRGVTREGEREAIDVAAGTPAALAARTPGALFAALIAAGIPTARASAAVAAATGATPGGAPAGSAGALEPGAELFAGVAGLAGIEPSSSAVAAAALPAVAAERRSRFEAVYLAITQSNDGRTLSPSARAARALAILSRDESATAQAAPLERAAAAWSMLPLVLGGGDADARPSATSATSATGASRTAATADTRPGMQPLASRAGDALGSFVAPSRAELDTARGARSTASRRHAPETSYVDPSVGDRDDSSASGSSTASSGSSRGAVRRAPTASPELVRTGMPYSRAGGGETEIPPWFESAARALIADRSPGSDMSVTEMTLVTAAPAAKIAASTRGESAGGSATAPAAAGSQSTAKGEKPDIDRIAQEVYGEILRLIDIARERNGEPYL